MKTAVALVGFNRPRYLKEVLHSFEMNVDVVDDFEWYAFLDGPIDGDFSAQNKQQQALLASTIDWSIIQHRTNVGCGLNMIWARKYLFEECNYDRVFVMEDDLVVSPTYFTFLSSLMNWCDRHYDDVGAVQGYWHCRESKDWKAAHLADVTAGNPHWWGYLMKRDAWMAMHDTIDEYAGRFLLNRYYWQRDEPAIRDWMLGKVLSWDKVYNGPRHFPHHWHEHVKYWQRREHPLPASGQDSATALAMQIAGYKKIASIVNRGVNIGEYGMHTTTASWQRNRMHEIVLDIFDDVDKLIDEFVPVAA